MPSRPPATVRGAMQGYLLRRPRDPLALKLATHCAAAGNNALRPLGTAQLRVRVFQARRLAVRPLFEPMYARHGLRTRVYLVRGSCERREPIGRVLESERNAGGSMRHPMWHRSDRGDTGGSLLLPLELLDEEERDVSLVVEVVCGILVVAATSVPLGEFLAQPTLRRELETHWRTLEGDGGLVELALDLEHLQDGEGDESDQEEEEEEKEEELSVGASAWAYKQQARESGNNHALSSMVEPDDQDASSEDDDDPDEPKLEYSSSSGEEPASRLEDPETVLGEMKNSLDDGLRGARTTEEDAEEKTWRVMEATRRSRFEIPPEIAKEVTVARAGGTTMYIPHQTATAGGGSLSPAKPAASPPKRKANMCRGSEKAPPASEQERLMDKQLWDLYVFGIADRAPSCRHLSASSQEEAGREDVETASDRDEEQASAAALEASTSWSSRAPSTCVSDVLAYNEFIQNMEAAITQERLGKHAGDNQESRNAVVGAGRNQAEPEEPTLLTPHAKSSGQSLLPVRQRTQDPSPRPREGVVLFDPASLPTPLDHDSLASRHQQRRRSVMPGTSADAARAQAQSRAPRRRSLPINAVYAQLQRKLLAGVNALRRQPDKHPQGDTQQQQQRVNMPAPATATTPELGRKRSMSLHAYTDLFAPPVEPMDPCRHRSNSNGVSTASRSNPTSGGRTSSRSGSSSDSLPPAGLPLASSRRSAETGPVVYLQGEPVCVGRRILVGRSAPGIVRYIGSVLFASGAWVGVELAEPKGKHDGAVDGVRYFSCAPHHGILLRANRLDLRLL